MVPRLDEAGDSMPVKKPRMNGKTYKEQRTTLKVLHEYYIVEKKEQEAFMEMFAVNFKDYNYSKYLRDIETEPQMMEVEKPSLVTQDGRELKA